jgi:hypothetical protein
MMEASRRTTPRLPGGGVPMHRPRPRNPVPQPPRSHRTPPSPRLATDFLTDEQLIAVIEEPPSSLQGSVYVERDHAFSMASIRRLQTSYTQRCAKLEREIVTLQALLSAQLEASSVAEARAAQAEDRAASLEARAVSAERLAEIEAHEAKVSSEQLAVVEPRTKALATENAFLREQTEASELQRRVLGRLFQPEDEASIAQGDLSMASVHPIGRVGPAQPEAKDQQLLLERVREASAGLDAHAAHRHRALSKESTDGLHEATGHGQRGTTRGRGYL